MTLCALVLLVMGEQRSEKLGSKQMAKSTPPSPVEKVSTLRDSRY